MKEKITLTKTHKIFEVLTLLIMISTFIYLLLSWHSLPSTIVDHFNALGEPDNWSNKNSILFNPLFTLAIYAVISAVQYISPEMIKTPISMSKCNGDYIQTLTENLLAFFKLVIICDFSYMTLCTIQQKGLSPFFLPLFILFIFLPIIFFFFKIYKYEKHSKRK